MIDRELEELLNSLNVRYHKHPFTDGVNYEIAVRTGIHLQLDLDLYVDQLDVNFNGCYTLSEVAAYEWRFRRNPQAFDQWRTACLSSVRDIMTSDLRVETKWLFDSLLGGYLYRWNGQQWECCGGGGSLFLFIGMRRVSEYRSWLA